MLIIPPTEYRKRRERGRRPVVPAPAALVLTFAFYLEEESIDLTFDRAIDIAALDASQITIDDGPVAGAEYVGTGAGLLVTPTKVRIALANVGPSSSSETLLSATNASGIVAVDDGGAWSGVSDVELPFG